MWDAVSVRSGSRVNLSASFTRIMAATTALKEVGHPVATGPTYLNRHVTGQNHSPQPEVTDEAALTEGNLDRGNRGA